MSCIGSERAALELGGARLCPYARALLQLRERRLHRNDAGSISAMLLKKLINGGLFASESGSASGSRRGQSKSLFDDDDDE